MRPQIVKILALVLFAFNSTIMLAQSKGSGTGPPSPNQKGPQTDCTAATHQAPWYYAVLRCGPVCIKAEASR